MTSTEELMRLCAEESVKIATEHGSFEGDFKLFHEGWVQITSAALPGQRTFIRADRIIAVTILTKTT